MVKKFYKAETYDVHASIGYLIRTGSNLITPRIEALFVETDLTFIQYVILMNLRYELAGNSGELCQLLRYDSGAITRVIDQLEKRKLLERKRCTADRRIVKLRVTQEAVDVLDTLIPLVVDQYNEWLADFTREEATLLIKLLTRLITKIASDQRG